MNKLDLDNIDFYFKDGYRLRMLDYYQENIPFLYNKLYDEYTKRKCKCCNVLYSEDMFYQTRKVCKKCLKKDRKKLYIVNEYRRDNN